MDARRSRGVRGLRALALAPARGMSRLRKQPPPESVALPVLVLLSLLAIPGSQVLGLEIVPTSFQVVPLLGGALLLRTRAMRRLLVAVAVVVGYDLVTEGVMRVRPGTVLVLVVTAVVAYEFARSREETGLAGATGDTLLLELRERLQQQGRLPVLPEGWAGDVVVRPAGGAPFAGDFVVSSLTDGGQALELALVDVSGKGIDAGTRALLLSGALGGLLGSLRPEDFLPAANRYLDRQDWDEGFATAVHLVLDLRDGRFVVESAGHPPVAHFAAGSGRWSLVPAEGLALGLLPDVTYVAQTGRLDVGDALILYTDGLVEIPGRDLSVGIDKLLGEAERLVPLGFADGADLLVSRVAGAAQDDRGLVLLWRTR